MRITNVELYAASIEPLIPFYESIGWRLKHRTADHVCFRVGWTTVCFRDGEPSNYHLALHLASDAFVEARSSIPVPLLIEKGKDSVHFPAWNADSYYFLDPLGNIIEWIAHHEPGLKRIGPAASPLGVSEIGIVVKNVPEAVAWLKRMGLTPWQKPSDTFAAVGDAEGRLIIVPAGRRWYFSDATSTFAKTTVRIEGIGTIRTVDGRLSV
ncbi:VOC family protein [Exiguobacterium flavidum]|uniref:VOC family protein n=1 Tax=Exiguobacterium flavidum TaxID=2184695 RepID=UPI000DF838E1|nr:hypothetical protein [Exiguobacterium flavidum]